MSISVDGVKFVHKPKKGLIILMILGLIEFVFTILLFIALSANIWMPERTQAAPGISKILSYQGRLTDTSGNPLGGAGTDYCFRFSIYNAASGGTKLWPAGTPSTMTVNVANGVFNVGIGDTAAGGDDLSGFNFYENDTIYLNVEVANQVAGSCTGVSFESLSPRQRIDAVGYARATRDVYGDLLRTLNAAGRVQIGTGAGVASGQKLLGLDVKNVSDTIGAACSPSGTLWYNSANSRALVCDAGTIQEIGNLGTIVGIKEQSAPSAITSGTVNFSAITNLTISQDGQTLRFSGPSLANAIHSSFANILYKPAQQTQTVAMQSTFVIFPIVLSNAVSFDYLRLIKSVSIASTTFSSTANTSASYSQAVTFRGVLYSKNTGASSASLAAISTFTNSLAYSLRASYGSATNDSQIVTMGITYPISTGTSSFSTTQSTSGASWSILTGNFTRLTGIKFLDIPFVGSLSPNDYWLALNATTTATTGGATNLSGARLLYSTMGFSQPNVTFAFFGEPNTASVQAQLGIGSFSAAGGATTASLGFSSISSMASHIVPYISFLKSDY